MLELWGCGVPLHCHRSEINSDPLWYHLKKVLSMGQIGVFDILTLYFDIKTESKQMAYAKLNSKTLNRIQRND